MSNITKKYLSLLPTALASRAFGVVSEIPFPGRIQKTINSAFAKLAHIDVNEAAQPIESYDTLNEFFTRTLKEGARPIANSSVVSPVDGTISAFGRVTDDTVLTVKHQHFNVNDLVGTTSARDWLIGSYFFIIYLSPTNYHRIHAPIAGNVTHMSYVPGQLLPVNRLGLAITDELFPTNERLTTFMETESGKHVALVKVGATCVGKISVTYDDQKTNISRHPTPYFKTIDDKPVYDKGQELAAFNLGSTVILFIEGEDFKPDASIKLNAKIKMGEALGEI